ncbi:MAG: ABC transporter permease [Desulfurococcus sp.]|nr:ABC transporter permease [Desulfurococcus sp.]
MNAFLKYIFMRFIYFLITIISAFSITFILLRFMPVDAVENIVAMMTAQGQVVDPEALKILRRQLYELFGLTGTIWDQYLKFLRSAFTFDFGPSIMSFPTPVVELIEERLPYTLWLLGTSIIISWVLGNIIGMIASLKEDSIASKILQSIAVTLYPIPYYILALLLVFLFIFKIPLFPLVSSFAISLNTIPEMLRATTLPALSIILISALGWWFLSSRALTLRVLSEDYVRYAVIRALPEKRIIGRYVFRNILTPQVTALGLSLGQIFSGALLTEVVFAYPGIGQLLYRSVMTGDIPTAIGIVTLSIYATALATFILDVIYVFIDPRVRLR